MSLDHYPNRVGFKERNGTSEASAIVTEGRVQKLQRLVKEALKTHGPLTADEAATLIGETEFSTRPRFTELYRSKEVEKSGETRRNKSGHAARVWRLPMKQGELFV